MSNREEQIRSLISLIEYIRDDLVILELESAADQLNAAIDDLQQDVTIVSGGLWVSCGDH